MTARSSAEIFDENYKIIKDNIASAAQASGRNPEDIIILAATKTVDTDTINYAVNKGIKFIGENRVQEFLGKYEDLAPVRKHFIGHLQKNKVKYIIDKVEMIESVSSLALAEEISRQAVKNNLKMNVLLEVNIGKEESKSGFFEEEVSDAVYKIAEMPGICVKGLMAIPPVCTDIDGNSKYFYKMHKLFIDIGGKKIDNSSMDFLSMGMSGDYKEAVLRGANIVRIGTALFGDRNYF